MSDPVAFEPTFDPTVSPVACSDCGQRVVRVPVQGEREPACPICRGREAAARALEEGAVPAGRWPRLVLLRGAPLAGGALACPVPGSEAELDAGDGPLARLRRDGERLLLTAVAPGIRLDGALVSPGQEFEVSVGARLVVSGRELGRA